MASPKNQAPCGTVAAYKRHRRHGEIVDESCRLAWNEQTRQWYHKRQAKRKKVAK